MRGSIAKRLFERDAGTGQLPIERDMLMSAETKAAHRRFDGARLPGAGPSPGWIEMGVEFSARFGLSSLVHACRGG